MKDIGENIRTIREYLTHIAEVVGNKDFQDKLDKAGSIAALVSLGIGLYKDIKERAQSKDEKAFNSLIKAAFECAQESMPENSSKITLGDKSKDIRKELFNIFTIENGWINYLPDHPVIKQFKSHFRQVLEIEGNSNLIRDFIIRFNKQLEDKIDRDPNLAAFREREDDLERSSSLSNHLDYTETLIYEVDEIGNRILADYYTENYAVKADILEDWDKEDSYYLLDIDSENGNLHPASTIVMDSVTNSDNPYTIVGAPFGIGKTSLSLKISSVCAQKYSDDPDRNDNYIPVFAPLKHGSLDTINENGQSLEDVLESIAPIVDGGGEARKKKIVVICDGLDEFIGSSIYELKSRLDALRKKDKYPNIKFVITTRLEANIPHEFITGLSTYIRLLPFSKNQVDDFFRKSTLPQYSFEQFKVSKVMEEVGGAYEDELAYEIRKPLFCWMFALMIDSSPDIAKVLEQQVAHNDQQLRRALIYQGFIHSIIIGKHKESAKKYLEKYSEEKNILRKIAALKQMYAPEVLKESTAVAGLRDYYGLNYNTADIRKNKIITSYFYFKGTNTTDKAIGFIHKSFMEHLLAEYYIESASLDYNMAKYYLNIAGIPSPETIKHLHGLLSLLNCTNEEFKKQINTLVQSLGKESVADFKKSTVYTTKRIFEAEEILLQKDRIREEGIKNWVAMNVSNYKYARLSIHRWLSLFILNKLSLETCIFDKQMISQFISLGDGEIPGELKRFVKMDLQNTSLWKANLFGANFCEANLSDVSMIQSDLWGADLSHSTLTGANLSGSNLQNANLAEADLSWAALRTCWASLSNFAGANLSNAKLDKAILTGADLLE